MLLDTYHKKEFLVDTSNWDTKTVSFWINKIRQLDLHSKPGVFAMTGVPQHAGRGLFFEPLSGLHFGTFGPFKVEKGECNDMYYDIPLLTFILVLDGESAFIQEGTTYSVKKNMFFFGRWDEIKVAVNLPKQECYSHIGFSVEPSVLTQHFGTTTTEQIQLILKNTGHKINAFTGIAGPETITAAKALLSIEQDSVIGYLPLRCAAVDFFAKLVGNISFRKPATTGPTLLDHDIKLLTGLKERIEREYLDLPPMFLLCEELGMSESKAKKSFKHLFAVSIARYIQQCKMVHAHALLVERKMNVSQCAFTLGYSNVGHFITAFKKYYGITPKEANNAGKSVMIS